MRKTMVQSKYHQFSRQKALIKTNDPQTSFSEELLVICWTQKPFSKIESINRRSSKNLKGLTSVLSTAKKRSTLIIGV